ncbi:hypothetical protein [Aestuariivirga litoralis]|uniref:hypothetical protein n=1 Tax=Aestuariivirga litoralis TaxID=2650924 RepID=UPI0018C651C2|nr:hypothetical protein [Aestuariivirga litoralis]MBG1231424.1 hypothetical protein [Aestuariivirga litoralis]
MKSILASLVGLALLSSAASAAQMVGGSKDAHGCIGPAGYVWSVVQARCVRAFEVGHRLDPTTPSANTVSAFVVFPMGGDQTRAELHLPWEKAPLIAKRIIRPGAVTWTAGSYKLVRAHGMYSLSKGTRLLYRGTAAQ